MAIHNWDYNLAENWQPKTDRQWLWYLGRKINYDDWDGLKKEQIKRYLPQLRGKIDPGKFLMLELYFKGNE